MTFNFESLDRVFVVAEIGNNHEGNFDLAIEMIEAVATTGVDAVKFQTFIPAHYVSSSDPTRLERLTRFMLTHDQHRALAERARKLNLIFFSTPFDIQSAYFLNEIQSIFKISSGDNNFYHLIKTIASFNKPTIISTGLADLALLKYVENIWEKVGGRPAQLSFMHCVSSYPTPDNQANLGAIRTLQEHFPKMTIGYSDHTLGIKAAVLAVAAGAKMIEKHFTLNKMHSDFRDHQLSADPAEMESLVSQIREASILMGSGKKEMQQCEQDMESAMRRSIAAARIIHSGETLCMADLTWVRPGIGIPAGRESEVIGKRILQGLNQGELINRENLM